MRHALFVFLVACGGSNQASTQAPTTTNGAQAVPAHETVTTVNVPPAIASIVAAADRSADDKAMDAGRHPAETLAFFGVAPGMKVAEIGGGPRLHDGAPRAHRR